jgi:hypothetical protein
MNLLHPKSDYFFLNRRPIGHSKGDRPPSGDGDKHVSSSSLLGQNKDEAIASLPVDELIEKADGFAGVFPGMHFLSLLEFLL